jgi:superfamily II RNA helicase
VRVRRVERPWWVRESIREGLVNELDAQVATSLMAALAADADRDFGELELNDTVMTALTKFEQIAFNVSTEEWKRGVEPEPDMNLSAAATAWRWAGGIEWPELVRETKAEEGDLVRMLSRTGESLLQIARLRETQPVPAAIAATAAEIVLREPVRQD